MNTWKTSFKNPHFPSPDEFCSYLDELSDEKIGGFINLWLSEGIPKIVLERPEEYQRLRENIASHLKIHSKAITLIGSARFGYSLNPKKNYKSFVPGISDLDLSIIDEEVFERFTKEFFDWVGEYEQGIVQPRNYEIINWPANKNSEPRKIVKGIFDLNRIPAYPRYTNGQSFLNKLSIEQIHWNERNPNFNVKKITARLYKNWDSFVRQNIINLRALNDK